MLSRFLLIVITVIVLCSPGLGASDNDSAVRDRYLESALKNPRRGTTVERLFQLALQTDGVDGLLESLKKNATEDKQVNAWTLIGLLQDMRGREVEALNAFQQAADADPQAAYPRYCLGQIRLIRNEYPQAIEALLAALKCELTPEDDLEIRKALGRSYLRSRQFAQAKQVWSELVKLAPDDIVTLKELTALLVEEEQWDEAIGYYQRLRKLQQDRPYQAVLCTMAIGQVEARRGKFDDALTQYEEALFQVKPDSWLAMDIRNRVQELFRKRNDLSGLVAYYETRLAGSEAKDVHTMILHAQLLVEMDRAKDARVWYEKALKLSPKDTDVRLAYIRLLELQKDYAAAIKEYDFLLADKPSESMWLEAIGSLHLKVAQDKPARTKAAQAWERIAAANPNDAATMVQVAEIFRSHEMTDQADAYFRKAIELAPGVGQYREYYGEFLVESDKRDEALAAFQQIAEGPRKSIETLMRLADVLSYFQYPEQSVAASREAVALKPDHFEARVQLARLLGDQSKFDPALKELDEAARLAPNDFFAASVVDQRINLLQRSKKLEEAYKQLAETLANESAAKPTLYIECAKMALALSRLDEAETYVQKATESEETVSVLELAVQIYTRASDAARLEQTLRRLVELAPQNRKDYLRQLTVHYMSLSDSDRAVQTAGQVIAAGPDDPQSHALLASVCERFGMPDRSIKSLKEALRVDPKNADLRVQYARQIERDGQTDEALEQLWIVFDMQDSANDKLSTMRLLAESAYRADRFQQLVDRLERMRRVTQDDWLPVMCLAEAYRQIEDLTRARELLNSLLAERPDDANLLNQLVKLATTEGANEEAVRHLQKLVEIEPSRRNQNQLANLLYDLDRKDEALAAWQKSAQLSDNKVESLIEVARDLLTREESKAALDLLAEAVKLNADSLDLGYFHASALLMAERKDEASREFLRVVELSELPAVIEKNKKQPASGSQIPSSYRSMYFPPELQRFQKLAQMRYQMQDRYRRTSMVGGRQVPVALSFQGDPEMLRYASWYRYCEIAREQDKYDALIESLKKEDTVKSLQRLVENYCMEEKQPKDLLDVFDALQAKAPNDSNIKFTRLMMQFDRRMREKPEESVEKDNTKELIDEVVKQSPNLEPFLSQYYLQYLVRCKRKDELSVYAKKMAAREFKDETEAAMALYALCEAEEFDLAMDLYQRASKQFTSSPAMGRYRTLSHALMQLIPLAVSTKHYKDAAQLSAAYIQLSRPKTPRVTTVSSPYYYYGSGPTETTFPMPNAYYDAGRLQMLQRVYSAATGEDPRRGMRRRIRVTTMTAGGVQTPRAGTSQPANKDAQAEPPALAALRKLLEKDPTSSNEDDRIYAHLALAYFDWWQKKKDDAAMHVAVVTELRPQDISLKMSLASLRYNMDDKEGALKVLQSIPGRYHAMYRPAQQLILRTAKDLKRTDEAKAAALRLFNLKLSSSEQLALANDLYDLGLSQKARQLEQRITSLSSNDLRQLVELMRARSDKGDKKEAANLAQQILAHLGKSDPNFEYYRDRALRILKESGDLENIIAKAEKQLAENPNSLRVLMDLWNYYSAAEKYDKAVETARKLVELRPGDLQLRSQMAKALLRNKQGDAAMEHYQYILAKDPSIILGSFPWETVRTFREAGKINELLEALTAMDFAKLSRQSSPRGPLTRQLVDIARALRSNENPPALLPFLNKLNDTIVDDNQQSYQLVEIVEIRYRALTAKASSIVLDNRWAIAGPFDNSDDKGFDTAYPIEEQSFDHGAKFEGKNGATVKWLDFRLRKNRFDGKKDIKKKYKDHENIVVYAHTTINSAVDTTVKAYAGSDDGIKVWINGELVLENNVIRGMQTDSDVFDITLHQGTNDVLLKIVQYTGNWGFCFRIDDLKPDVLKQLERKWEAIRYMLSFVEEFKTYKPVPPKDLPNEAIDRPLGVKTKPVNIFEPMAWGHPYGDPHGLVDEVLKEAAELGQLKPMREHLDKISPKNEVSFTRSVWKALLDLQLDRIDEVKAALPGIIELVDKKESSQTNALHWLDDQLMKKKLTAESLKCCEVVVDAHSQSQSWGLEHLLWNRLANRLIKAGQKERGKVVLLALAEMELVGAGYPSSYIMEQKVQNMRFAAEGLDAAGFYQEAYDVAKKLVDLASSSSQTRRNYEVTQAKQLMDRLAIAHNLGPFELLTAAVPINEHELQILWTPKAGKAEIIKREAVYAFTFADKALPLDGFEAEVQVAAEYSGTYRTLGKVPAEQHQFIYTQAPSGKLLWFRVVLRDQQGKVAALSEHVAGVAGKNLVADGSMEAIPIGTIPATRPADEQSSWTFSDSEGKPCEKFSIVAGGRPLSQGSRFLSAENEEEVEAYGKALPTDRTKVYLLGGWIRCESGVVRLRRLALDENQDLIRRFNTMKLLNPSDWVFYIQRLAAQDDQAFSLSDSLVGKIPGANRFAKNQRFSSVNLLVTGKAAFDDLFMIEYEPANDEMLSALPVSDKAEIDQQASESLLDLFRKQKEAQQAAKTNSEPTTQQAG